MSGPTPCRASRPGARAVTSGTMRSRAARAGRPGNSTRRPTSAARRGWRTRGRPPGGAAAPRGAGQGGGRVPGEPGPQIVRAGQDQRTGLVDGLGPLVAGAALGHHERPDRLHRPVAALRRPGRPAGLRGPRRADRVQRVRLAVAAAVLPVGPVDLDDPDPGCGQMPGQARAVAAGALNADQGDGPEPGQPAEQAGVPGCGGRGFPTPSSPPRGSSAAATSASAWVSTPPVMARVSFTIVIAVPFLWLRDGTHPLAAVCESRPLAQARQIGPAAPVGAKTRPSRRAGVKTTHKASGRITGQTRAWPRPYARTHANPRKQGRGSTHILPADSAPLSGASTPRSETHIILISAAYSRK